MSRKVADVSEFSEINLIDGTFCCNGLQFHLFSSVIKRYPYVKVYCDAREVLDISINRQFYLKKLLKSYLQLIRLKKKEKRHFYSIAQTFNNNNNNLHLYSANLYMNIFGCALQYCYIKFMLKVTKA